jgi:RNA polymerase sigma-70 factor (sigma-E family)
MNSSGFDEFFAQHFERCVWVARRVVRRDDIARDVAAEAFARAWVRWHQLEDQVPGAWVTKVTVNLAIDHVRRRPVETAMPEPTRSPEDASIAKVTLACALRALPARQRSAIVLRYLADCSEEEIAAALRVSKGSVKVHLHRGLKRLRTMLDAGHLAPLDPESRLKSP